MSKEYQLTDKPKILVINSLYSPYIGGGAEIICQNLAEELNARGYEVFVLTTGGGSKTIKDTVNGIPVIRMGLRNLYFAKQAKRPHKIVRFIWHLVDMYNPLAKIEVDRIIADLKPNVALCHNISGFSISLWSSLYSHNIPIIEVLHDQYLRCPNCNTYKNGKVCNKQCLTCRLMRLPHRRISRKVNTVVGVSEYVLNSMVGNGYFKDSKKYVIHNAQAIESPEEKRHWDGRSPLKVGYIGTLTEAKGIKMLIEVFKSLSINAELYIAGSGNVEYENSLKNLAKEDQRIKFLGYVKSCDFYELIDVCVMPSLWPDTFPGVAYESCAYHVPVIASDIGGIPEIIHHGRNGLRFKSGDKLQLRDAILSVYNHPENLCQYSSCARHEVESMLSPEKMVDRYEEIVKSVCQ